MPKEVQRSDQRGFFNHGWLQTHHSFSFADYFNPEKMGFGALRVINDDVIAPGAGFGMHPHENMEIVTIVLSGALAHRDSMGNISAIHAGEVQVMSAGTGVLHSEFNASESEPVSLFQIWILPDTLDVTPRYAEHSFGNIRSETGFQTLVGPKSSGAPLWIHQNALISLADLEKGERLEYALKRSGNGIYLLVVEGEGEAAGEAVARRDALSVSHEETLAFAAKEKSRVLVLEVPL